MVWQRLGYVGGSFLAMLVMLIMLVSPVRADDSQSQTCQQANVALQVLGSGGPEIDDGRASTAYLLWVGGKAKVMIDMGGGSAWRFEQSGANLADLDAVLFTHFHVDHSADFPVFVKAGFFTERTQDLPIYGPDNQGKGDLLVNSTVFVDRLFDKERGVYPYLSGYFDANRQTPFNYIAHDVPVSGDALYTAKPAPGLDISGIPVNHGFLPAMAWRIDVAGKSVTISGDMNGERQTLERLAKGTDLLVAHAAIHEHTQGAGAFLHMKPTTIGRIAQQANAKKVVLSHFMNRSQNRMEAMTAGIRAHYQGALAFATDLSCWVID